MTEVPQYNILIIDDEPAIRNVFCHFLTRRGHQVVACGSSAEARREAEKTRFDVIVTDLVLPDGTGLDLARDLRAVCPDAKVILLTGEPSDETARRADALDIFKYLAKPIRASALIEVIEEAAQS